MTSVHSNPTTIRRFTMKIKTKVRGGGSSRCAAPKLAIA
jgi:hypothetical protein